MNTPPMNKTALQKFLDRDAAFTDRYELAQVLEMTVDTLRNNEKKLGLDTCKVSINSRFIRYHRAPAIGALRKKGVIPP